jgi:predicted AAA+ superfamily ATPase
VDEVQLEPELFRALKAEVDRDRTPGRFVITGSSRLLAAQGLADALVGRVEVLELWPFAQAELSGTPGNLVDALFEGRLLPSEPGPQGSGKLGARVLAGGFPEVQGRTPSRRARWFDSYVLTVQSALSEGSRAERMAELRRLLRLCAARTAMELNVASMASELGLPARTLDGYLGLLSSSFLVQLLPAWSTNLSSKVVRHPKLLMADSGLAAHLLGLQQVPRPNLGAAFGPLLETFVAGEVRKPASWSEAKPALWHFRDRAGPEVDLVLEHPDSRVVGIEVKATSTPRSGDLKDVQFLSERLGERFCAGVLLSAAPEAIPFGSKLAALPVSSLWHASAGPPG